MLADFLSSHTKIFKAMSAVQYSTIDASVFYVTAHLLKKRREITKTCGVYTLSTDAGLYLVPYEEMTPKEFLGVILSVLKRYPNKTVYEVPFAYRNALKNLGFQVEEDTIDTRSFIFSTAHLISALQEGRRYRELRRLYRRFQEDGGYFRLLTKEDASQAHDLGSAWLAEKKAIESESIIRQHDPAMLLAMWDQFPEEWEAKAVGAFTKDNQLKAFAFGCRLTQDQWSCVYSYGLRNPPSTMNLCWLKLAEYFVAYPYENDGNGQGTLHYNKAHFLSPEVEGKQMFVGYAKKSQKSK